MAQDPYAAAAPPARRDVQGRSRRPEFQSFYLDHAGQVVDPLNHQPAETPVAEPILLDGFGYDPVAKAPAKGVDVVLDGHAYAAAYGRPRPDVASFNKNLQLTLVGYALTLPAGTLKSGPHSAIVRVIAADGKGYFEGPPIPFSVK